VTTYGSTGETTSSLVDVLGQLITNTSIKINAKTNKITTSSLDVINQVLKSSSISGDGSSASVEIDLTELFSLAIEITKNIDGTTTETVYVRAAGSTTPTSAVTTEYSASQVALYTTTREYDELTGVTRITKKTSDGVIVSIIDEALDGSQTIIYPVTVTVKTSNYTYVKKYIGNSGAFSVADRRRFNAIESEKVINKAKKIFTANDAHNLSHTILNHTTAELVKLLRRR
jgi:hypothetical protein